MRTISIQVPNSIYHEKNKQIFSAFLSLFSTLPSAVTFYDIFSSYHIRMSDTASLPYLTAMEFDPNIAAESTVPAESIVPADPTVPTWSVQDARKVNRLLNIIARNKNECFNSVIDYLNSHPNVNLQFPENADTLNIKSFEVMFTTLADWCFSDRMSEGSVQTQAVALLKPGTICCRKASRKWTSPLHLILIQVIIFWGYCIGL